jgi:hypothetical protein
VYQVSNHKNKKYFRRFTSMSKVKVIQALEHFRLGVDLMIESMKEELGDISVTQTIPPSVPAEKTPARRQGGTRVLIL